MKKKVNFNYDVSASCSAKSLDVKYSVWQENTKIKSTLDVDKQENKAIIQGSLDAFDLEEASINLNDFLSQKLITKIHKKGFKTPKEIGGQTKSKDLNQNFKKQERRHSAKKR